MEMICKKCGKFHDDGISELCFDCLDDMATAPEDVQELTETIDLQKRAVKPIN